MEAEAEAEAEAVEVALKSTTSTSLIADLPLPNSRKSVRWSAVPVAPMWVCGSEMVKGAAAPKVPMAYAL